MNTNTMRIQAGNGYRKHFFFLLLIGVINLIIYRDYWAGSTIFTGKDTFTAYMPLINFEVDCLREGSFPLWNPFLNFGFPYVEDVLNSALFPTHLLMALTGSSMVMYQRELLFWIFLGGAGVYLCVRELGHSGPAGLAAAVSFMFCGQIVVLPTWSIILYNACCFPYLLLGYHRAKRLESPFNIVSILFFVLPLYAGYVSSSVHGIYYFIGYVLIDSLLSKRLFFSIQYLFVTCVAAMLLALPKLLPVFLSMGNYERMSVAEAMANPFEVITIYNFLSFLLPVKYYFSVHIGQLSIIALIYSMVRRTFRMNALLVMCLISGWLLLVDSKGNFSILHTIANSVLPMMKLTRNEWMYWNYPLTFAILYCSQYVDGFLRDEAMRPKLLAALAFAVALSAGFFGAYDSSLHYEAYLVHLALAVIWVAAVAWFRRGWVQTAAVTILLLVEFLLVFNRVSVDEPFRLSGNVMDVTLTHQVYASESFRDNELVKQRLPIRVLWDDPRPTISDSRKWPYLISGLDGNFVDNMNLKQFGGWWYNTQERFDFVKLKESPLLAALHGQPLFMYFDRFSGQPVENAISFNGISCSDFVFRSNARQPGLFLLRQMFDERWKVSVDGREQPLLRADEYFMGVEMEPGDHAVRFLFRDRRFTLSLMISALTAASILITIIVQARKRRRSAIGR